MNCKLEVIDLCAEGDVVVARYKETGRWTGSFLHFDQPTGNSFELLAMEWFVVRNGLIAERWGVRDAASQARQLGFPMSEESNAKAA